MTLIIENQNDPDSRLLRAKLQCLRGNFNWPIFLGNLKISSICHEDENLIKKLKLQLQT